MISVYTYTSSPGRIQPSSPALSPPDLDLHSRMPHPHSAEGQSDRQSGTRGNKLSLKKILDPKRTNITMRFHKGDLGLNKLCVCVYIIYICIFKLCILHVLWTTAGLPLTFRPEAFSMAFTICSTE